ncbi:uncharacterized protein LOC123553842 isoform X2 [Mercenaria mercenaria]|uniref:uncharacterized protein LOC123553842 isoform X2 n=1 Tax=Mercenaria mercenaria TaxID=6596 RepID=UPI001E1D5EDA|nr:uncharacterized protein LOC123553842 isoform X2 [Mercenaria mercenaria]
MCCKNSWKTAGDLGEFNAECTCYKWFRRTCGLFFLVCFIAVACCVYCTFVLLTIREIGNSCRNNQHKIHINNEKIVQQGITENEKDIQSQIYNQVNITSDMHVYTARFKRAKERKKKCKCPKMLAGHYEQKTKPEYFEGISDYTDTKLIKPCQYIEKLKGNLCKAGDFKSETKTLQVFQPTPSLKAKSNPFKGIENGRFITKKKGTYLVYAQVGICSPKGVILRFKRIPTNEGYSLEERQQ